MKNRPSLVSSSTPQERPFNLALHYAECYLGRATLDEMLARANEPAAPKQARAPLVTQVWAWLASIVS